MQLGGGFWESAANIALESQRNRWRARHMGTRQENVSKIHEMSFSVFSDCFRAFKMDINLNTITQVDLFGFCS